MQINWLKRYNWLEFEEIDSTNSEALRMARSSIDSDILITAKRQTGGRGTKGRHWVSPEGNLYLSILLRVKFDASKNIQLSFVAANAVADAVDYLSEISNARIDIALKWPNDILIKGKKLAGILLESIKINEQNYVVIGIGININNAPKVDIENICLKDLGISINDSNKILNVFMNRFEQAYEAWIAHDSFVPTRQKWLTRAHNLQKKITISDGQEEISGIFKDIDLNGAMRLEMPDGSLKTIFSGYVI